MITFHKEGNSKKGAKCPPTLSLIFCYCNGASTDILAHLSSGHWVNISIVKVSKRELVVM